MKTIKTSAAQGDVMFLRINEIPADATPVAAEDGRHILAHSETGHHHAMRADGVAYFRGPDPFTCYLRVDGSRVGAEVTHERPFDTHETVLLTPGSWLVRRQREYVPQGYRMVQD
jgi:hypothetical protein